MSEPEEIIFVQLKHCLSGRESPRILSISLFFFSFLADRGTKAPFQNSTSTELYTKCPMNVNQVRKSGNDNRRASLLPHFLDVCCVLKK